MLLVFVLFLVLVIWGLKDGDIYWGEALSWTVLFVLLFAGMIIFKEYIAGFIIGTVLVDIILIIRIVGTDIPVH